VIKTDHLLSNVIKTDRLLSKLIKCYQRRSKEIKCALGVTRHLTSACHHHNIVFLQPKAL